MSPRFVPDEFIVELKKLYPRRTIEKGEQRFLKVKKVATLQEKLESFQRFLADPKNWGD
jgi:hypothetical protein